MSKFLPSNRAQGAVALLLLLVILIVGGAALAKVFVDAEVLELDARNAELELLQRRIKMPIPPKSAAADPAKVFVAGANYALAANSLQQRVVGLIESSGGTLVSVGIDPANTEDGSLSRRVIVQTVSEVDNDGLQNLMYHLETERPLILLDSLTVRRSPTRGETEDDSRTSPRLAVDLRVVGYYRKATQ